MSSPKYSVIVPVYNRPGEVKELLESLATQPTDLFEVIIVEDGSALRSEQVVSGFTGRMDLTYLFQQNAGPGKARNQGSGIAKSNYLLFLDSDVIVPPGYFEALDALPAVPAFFGGPDKAAPGFSPVQKAISYSMTSFLTTGGIRGKKSTLEAYKPRSFNMGIKKELFHRLGGFRDMRFGEDIDLSLRVEESGVKGKLVEDAWVYHKRRTNFGQFFKQVYNSGVARIHLHLLHPGSMKAVHTFPALFTAGTFFFLLWAIFFNANRLLPLLLYAAMILIDSAVKNGLLTGFLSIAAAFVQLTGYGLGFLRAAWQVFVLRKKPVFGFEKNFYN